jgi:DNA-directed RNA polymerase specialized sigma24 family protein
VEAHIADDGFQSTVRVLIRRSATTHPREDARQSPYRVVALTTQKVSAMSTRHRTREIPTGLPTYPPPARSEPDLNERLLVEERASLPDHLRAMVVLCAQDGLTHKAAAARLEIPEKALSGRLAKARSVLADRLRRRGATLAPVELLRALGQMASAKVPPRLLSGTAALAAESVPVSMDVSVLSSEILRCMFLTRLWRVPARGGDAG